MKKLFKLKTKVFCNQFKGTPLIGIIFLFALAAGAILALFKLNTSRGYYVLAGLALVLSAIHLSRKDFHFCEKLLTHPQLFFALEYSLITVPFAVMSALDSDYQLCVLYVLLPVAVAFIPNKKRRWIYKSRPLLIKMPSLETTSFFRKYRPLIWVSYATCLALTFANGISMVLLYFLMLFYAVSSFSQAEPLTLLCIPEKQSEKFITFKIRKELFFWLGLSLPVVALYMIFNFETAYSALIPLLLGPMSITMCICMKYANYIPSKAIPGTPFQVLCLLFLPLSLFMLFVYYRSAVDNLKPYLDDFYK